MDLTVTDYVKIQDLIARFNRALDERNWTSFGGFFKSDAIMTFSQDSRFAGRDTIVKMVRDAEEGSYAVNFHLGAGFTTDSVADDRVVIDLPVLGFGVFLQGKGEGLRFSGARSKWVLIRDEASWLISESHHRTTFAAATATA